MSLHTLFLPDHDLTRDLLEIAGDEARHAVKVKRVEPGDSVRITDGRGKVVTAVVESVRPAFAARVQTREIEPPVNPRVEVYTATPKGPRLEDMIEMLSQAGVSRWSPLETTLGVVEPGANKLERCERVARESAKQCGRAWLMEIGEPTSIGAALSPEKECAVLVADADGEEVPREIGKARVLVGPEGGFTPAELDQCRRAGAVLVRTGPHIMRIETAAVAAAVLCLGRRGG